MAWYDEAVFYHIYPLGLCGAPKENKYDGVTHRLEKLTPWIDHIKEIGCNAIYIGPLFESVGHGYETTDYKKLDGRLGDNADLTRFVAKCHEQGIRVILDGVFNHTGRDFFAFKDIQQNRENSRYRDWYCNVNFWGNTEYNDGFSYDNWGGYNLLVKLNQRNPEVKKYICDVIRFWVSEFDIDGIRLDAADVLDFDFMRDLRNVANEVKPDFWLMGEVIHGDYSRWANDSTLHSVTNYNLHKALYSGHNDHNYFEIAHTVKRLNGMIGHLKLYNFVDNHDVERIYTKLNKKAHFTPVHILLYTLPGIPSIYYGSEFAIEGRKEKWSDDSLRPALNLEDYKDAVEKNSATALIAALGRVHAATPALSYGDYNELLLMNRQYAFSRNHNGRCVIITVNNDDNDFDMNLPAGGTEEYVGALFGERVRVENDRINVKVKANSGEIWIPRTSDMADKITANVAPLKAAGDLNITGTKADAAEAPNGQANAAGADAQNAQANTAEADAHNAQTQASTAGYTAQSSQSNAAGAATQSGQTNTADAAAPNGQAAQAGAQTAQAQPESKGTYEDGVIAGLQQAIIAIMEKNGPVTDQMRRDVLNNVYHDSLITWIKSFR